MTAPSLPSGPVERDVIRMLDRRAAWVTPAPDGWEQIQARLRRPPSAASDWRAPRARAPRLVLAAAAAVLALGLIGAGVGGGRADRSRTRVGNLAARPQAPRRRSAAASLPSGHNDVRLLGGGPGYVSVLRLDELPRDEAVRRGLVDAGYTGKVFPYLQPSERPRRLILAPNATIRIVTGIHPRVAWRTATLREALDMARFLPGFVLEVSADGTTVNRLEQFAQD